MFVPMPTQFLTRMHNDILDTYSWWKKVWVFPSVNFSCVNSRTNGNTGLMSHEVTTTLRTWIHPDCSTSDHVCYGMTPYHIGTIIPLDHVVATHGLFNLHILKVMFWYNLTVLKLNLQVLVFKWIVHVPLEIDHDIWQQNNLITQCRSSLVALCMIPTAARIPIF